MATTFAVIYSYSDDTALREATRPAHRTYLRQLADEGKLLVAGAWAPGEAPGGLLIFRVEDKAAVQALVNEDPYKTSGVLVKSEVFEWAPPIGPVAGALTGQA